MSYPAIVYNIMLSSPSDAEKERNVLRDCVNRWNDSNSAHNEMVLLPLDCANNVPCISAGIEDPRGQAVVNKYIVEPSDWLVVVFKNTFGSPTGKEDSGTIEEIKLFRETKPQNPISVYFYESTQDERVKRYKTEFFGFWKEYKDESDLGKKFFIELSQVVFNDTCFRKKLADSKKRTEERAQVLLMRVASDTKNMAMVSRLTGQEFKVETNGLECVGYEMAFELLCKRRHLEKADPKGDIFKLTEIGKQEVETLKNFLAF